MNPHPFHRSYAKFAGLVATVAALLAVVGCAEPKLQDPVPSLDILQVLPASGTLEVGQVVSVGALRLQGRTSTNVTGTIEWASDDESVATVSYSESTGAVVEAVGLGTVHVTATDGDATGTAEFVVTASVASIELDKGMIELAKGTPLLLGATLITTDGKKRAVDEATWASSAPGVATVDEEGTVSGVGVGAAVITVVREGISASQLVYVRDWTLESIEAEALSGTTLPFGTSSRIRVTGRFSDDHTQDISALFELSAGEGGAETEADTDEAEALVTVEDGVVSAGTTVSEVQITGVGQAGSIVADEQFTLELDVVDTPLTALALELPPVLSVGGDGAIASVTGTFGDELKFEIPATLTAEPAESVSIDTTAGTVSALEPGTVTVTAATIVDDDGDDDPETGTTIEASRDIELVEDGVSELSIALASTGDDATTAIHEALELRVSARFGATVPVDVTDLAIWNSSDESIAVVSNVSAGKATGLAAGSATIQARYRDATADFMLTVSP
jgi:uncharacterized protein YjdB